MIEIILIISLSVIFIILLRRLPEVKLNSSADTHSLAQSSPMVLTPKPVFGNQVLKLWESADKEFNRKNLNKAEKLYLKIASKDPKNPKIYGRLGIIYLEQKNYLDAKEAFSEAIKRDSQNAFWHNNLGLAFYNLKRFNESIEAYKKSVEIDNTKAVRFFNLGLGYEAIGKYNDALRAYEKALTLEPNNLEFQNLVIRIKKELSKER